MSPLTKKKYRLSVVLNFILVAICLALFFSARNSDQKFQSALVESCQRDNILRTERNKETRVIKEILATIVKNADTRAKLLEKQGKEAEAKFTRKQAEPYAKYNKQIKLVKLTDCKKLAVQERNANA